MHGWDIPVHHPGPYPRLHVQDVTTICNLHDGETNAPIRKSAAKPAPVRENEYAIKAGLRNLDVTMPLEGSCSTDTQSAQFCGFCYQLSQDECPQCHGPSNECSCANPHDCNFWRQVWKESLRPREKDFDEDLMPTVMQASVSGKPVKQRVWPIPDPTLQGRTYWNHPAHDEVMGESEQELERPELDVGLSRYSTDNTIPPLNDPAVQAI